MKLNLTASITSVVVKTAVSIAVLMVSMTGFHSVAENSYSVFVDKNGIMRRSDTGEETRYFGTNYTLPFAHAYRAMNVLGVDHKDAIDRDVYHLSRMGVNAFRLHLWDVELTDSIGNLLENDHLDLLDYLVAQLEQRGITIILTAQTNFGNGYPEHDTDTGAYSCNYSKCDIHANPEAIKAQQRYVRQLAEHLNPYTSRTYADDRSVIAIEINNEPCHTTSPRQVKTYINSLVGALRKGGWKKPVLYNVSHNMDMVPGYYEADIQGTTYQWYPVGLVSGRERKGNFLPYVDDYSIPFSNVKGFAGKAKVVYEFDPADIMQSYMFPAVARTFAGKGFQWATQFAYDPVDMARFNTEYQTHFLNLAYTPQKALGMKIAARVMEHTPRTSAHPVYPADTVFGNALVSYRRNLSMWNSPSEYFYTNNTSVAPVAPDSLRHIAGYASSPVIRYQGLGAYMLDRVSPGIWRLEIMPDVLFSGDPFAKPSLSRAMAHIINTCHPIGIHLNELGDSFHYRSLSFDNPFGGKASRHTVSLLPGVYLLSADSAALHSVNPDMQFGAIRLNEYVAPPVCDVPLHVNHSPEVYAVAGRDLKIRAEVFGDPRPDSLVIYPAWTSFWRNDNTLYTMRQVAPYVYEAVIPASALSGKNSFSYRIAACSAGGTKTFPDAINGTPLDWDAPDSGLYTTTLLCDGTPMVLVDGANGMDGVEVSTIPDQWGRTRVEAVKASPVGNDAIVVTSLPGESPVTTVLTKYVGDIIAPAAKETAPEKLCVRTGIVENIDSVTISLVNRDGITYSAQVHAGPDCVTTLDLDGFTPGKTLLCPAPFPVFLSREFMPVGYDRPLDIADVEKIQIVFHNNGNESSSTAAINGIWLQ